MKLTIAIPTYNRAFDLNNLLISINQALLNINFKYFIEVLVCDNNSTDNTFFICENFNSKINNLRYIKNNQNIGLTANLYQCISNSRGDFIWMIGDDETISLDSLNIIFNQFEDNSLDLFIYNYSSEPSDLTDKFLKTNHGRIISSRIDNLIDLVLDWGWLWCLGNLGMVVARKNLLSSINFDLYSNCNFGQAAWYLEAFSNKKVKFVDHPVFRTYIRSQTVNKERWKTDDTVLRFINISSTVNSLILNGIIPNKLPLQFFNGCSANHFPIWGYLLHEIYLKIKNNEFDIDINFFTSILNLISNVDDFTLRNELIASTINLMSALNTMKYSNSNNQIILNNLLEIWSISTSKLISNKF
jgi:glycosyltransferase involved in cell wall biosynthesis